MREKLYNSGKPKLSSPQSTTKATFTYPVYWNISQHIPLESLHKNKFYKVPIILGLGFGVIHFTLLQDTDNNLVFIQANA